MDENAMFAIVMSVLAMSVAFIAVGCAWAAAWYGRSQSDDQPDD